MATSGMKLAVTSLSSWCLTMGKPPVGQLKARHTEWLSTYTVRLGPLAPDPHVSKTQSISQCTLVQGETIVPYGQGG